ncbi:MAG: putative Metallophos Calcineurin-like phosphoesterase [Bacteroidales bacterium]
MPMQPTIVIGDVHGSIYWRKAVKDNPDCRYVFLGDYLDPYREIAPQKLIDNLQKIIQLKKEQPQNVVLLLGNHDLHYITPKIEQSIRWDYDIAEEATELFLSHHKLFQYAFQEDNCVFTHAGIAHKWFTNYFQGDIHKNIADQLNHPAPHQKPFLYACGEARGGFADFGGIFWADRSELLRPLRGYTQIVGHNRVRDIFDYTNNGGRIIFCDCLWNKHYLKI